MGSDVPEDLAGPDIVLPLVMAWDGQAIPYADGPTLVALAMKAMATREVNDTHTPPAQGCGRRLPHRPKLGALQHIRKPGPNTPAAPLPFNLDERATLVGFDTVPRTLWPTAAHLGAHLRRGKSETARGNIYIGLDDGGDLVKHHRPEWARTTKSKTTAGDSSLEDRLKAAIDPDATTGGPRGAFPFSTLMAYVSHWVSTLTFTQAFTFGAGYGYLLVLTMVRDLDWGAARFVGPYVVGGTPGNKTNQMRTDYCVVGVSFAVNPGIVLYYSL